MVEILKYNSKVIKNVLIADTFIERFKGYMFLREPHYEAIIIKPCNSIHTFFMKFPIDVLFVNNHMEIIKKIESLERGKIITPVKEAKMVIEGKAGLFKDYQTGSKIVILY
ncbi:MAG TPA: DUF192 domain-containing protein [Clostridiales bacterium]|nr:DUF192 domain-containing protein [Clostridiales bacterium]